MSIYNSTCTCNSNRILLDYLLILHYSEHVGAPEGKFALMYEGRYRCGRASLST